MKKALLFVLIGLLPFATLACNKDEEILYVLNWGEYINEDLVLEFTEETGIIVEIDTADSNEAFKDQLDVAAATYDIVIPSDYMAEYLYDNDYLQKIDLTKLTHFAEANFLPGVNDIMDQLLVDNEDVTTAYEVCMPYFWGLFGLMYNNQLDGIEEYLETNEWGAVFGQEPAGLSESPKVGLYSVPRFTYAAALLFAADQDATYPTLADNAFNVYSAENLAIAESILSVRNYTEWGTDTMKVNIDIGDLDIAFTYVGDFFDIYLRNVLSENATTGAQAEAVNDHIGIYIPEHTIAFVDGMVLTKNAENVENAHKFIDFFLDPENAYKNSDIVGYSTTLTATYNMIADGTEGDLIRQTMVQLHPEYAPQTTQGVIFAPLIAFSTNDTSNIIDMVIRVRN